LAEEVAPAPAVAPQRPAAARRAIQPYLPQLRYLADIGFIRGLKDTLLRVEAECPEAVELVGALRLLTEAVRLNELADALAALAETVH
jgi:hypothetical protein